jgi:hypothetical protein
MRSPAAAKLPWSRIVVSVRNWRKFIVMQLVK